MFERLKDIKERCLVVPHSNYKVLITTSGIGSRVGNLTEYTNKSLIRIGDKAAISHIIEKYPEDIIMVITLGHFGDHVKQFLNLVYPNRKFEYIEVDPFVGEGSSLAYSMYQAKAHLQQPFIFHASDSLVFDEMIPNPDFDWVGCYSQSDATNYATIDVAASKVSRFHPKGMVDFDYIHIGVVGIYNYELFWKSLSRCLEESPSTSLNDVSALELMLKESSLKYRKFEHWFDIGNSNALTETRLSFENQNNVLEKVNESVTFTNNKVVKFFFDSANCRQRVEREKDLKGFVPQIQGHSNNFFAYSFVQGHTLSKSRDSSDIVRLLEYSANSFWVDRSNVLKEEIERIAEEFYVVKTNQRISQHLKSRGFLDSSSKINGTFVPKLDTFINDAYSIVQSDVRLTRFHGDFILDNIIKNDETFTFIDWRQNFGLSLNSGDMYYDLAKLNHSFIVNHSIIHKKLFEITRQGEEIELRILRIDTLVEMQFLLRNWMANRDLNVHKVSLLTALIWINMSPLHQYPLNDFLFEYGKYNLWRALND